MVMLTAHQSDRGAHEVFSAAVEEQLISPSMMTNEKEQTDQPDQNGVLAHALQGNHEAFAQIVNEYSTLMLRTATGIVGDRDIAEDIVQDSFIQAWNHLSDLRRAEALKSWLIRIVVNHCISFKRRLARSTAFMRQALLDQETDLIARIADDHKGCMERDWDLAHAIESLPVKQRVVIVLHYYNNMTLPEISQSLNTSENTLKKRIQAALNNLRRLLRFDEETAKGYSPSVA
jgi:RNA polymerase sigma-70 factor (ECF subfamily)